MFQLSGFDGMGSSSQEPRARQGRFESSPAPSSPEAMDLHFRPFSGSSSSLPRATPGMDVAVLLLRDWINYKVAIKGI